MVVFGWQPKRKDFYLFFNAEKVWPALSFLQTENRVYGEYVMSAKMAQFVFRLTDICSQRRIRGLSSVVTDKIKAKIESKMQEDMHEPLFITLL